MMVAKCLFSSLYTPPLGPSFTFSSGWFWAPFKLVQYQRSAEQDWGMLHNRIIMNTFS